MFSLTGSTLLRGFLRLEAERVCARTAARTRREQRLREGPASFVRGAPAFFYARCVRRGFTAVAPGADASSLGGGHGWLVGDVHLENVGAFAHDPGRFTFDFNDLDEAVVGPQRLDVLRGAAATMVAAQHRGLAARDCIGASEAFVQSYLLGAKAAPLPALELLVRRARERPAREWIDARCPKQGGARSFLAERGYLPLEATESAVVEGLFEAFRAKPPPGISLTRSSIEAAAFRVQGCASLGVRRYALLVRSDKRGAAGASKLLLLDAKEIRASALVLGRAVDARASMQGPHAERAGQAGRVEDAMRALLPRVPLGARSLRGIDGASYLLRVLAPGEDKLALADIDDGPTLVALARTVGAKLARAHARGRLAEGPPIALDATVDAALDLASELTRTYHALLRATPV